MLRRQLTRRRRGDPACRTGSACHHPPRLVLQVPAFGVTYRGSRRVTVGMAVLAAAALLAGAFTDRAPVGLVCAAVVVAAWAARSVRLLRLAPRGPSGPGRPGGGPAGVREPRRPRPRPPAGSMALAVPVEPPDEAAALA